MADLLNGLERANAALRQVNAVLHSVNRLSIAEAEIATLESEIAMARIRDDGPQVDLLTAALQERRDEFRLLHAQAESASPKAKRWWQFWK